MRNQVDVIPDHGGNRVTGEGLPSRPTDEIQRGVGWHDTYFVTRLAKEAK